MKVNSMGMERYVQGHAPHPLILHSVAEPRNEEILGLRAKLALGEWICMPLTHLIFIPFLTHAMPATQVFTHLLDSMTG